LFKNCKAHFNFKNGNISAIKVLAIALLTITFLGKSIWPDGPFSEILEKGIMSSALS
jgi:hypothetical protein